MRRSSPILAPPPHRFLPRPARVAAPSTASFHPLTSTKSHQYYWQQRLEEFRHFPADAEFTLTLLAPDRLILGEPETCVREFHRWREATGADYFLLRLRHAHSGGPTHEKIMEAIQLFGDRVLPHCR